ncbi:MAG: YdcF family protein [Phormidesmis sp.]
MTKIIKARYFALGLGLAIALYLGMIPARLTGVKLRTPAPQAIFVLGGGSDREVFAAQLALQHPELEIWVSTGSPPQTTEDIFSNATVSLSRLHLDYRATDTVTNFTTMVRVFRQLSIEHVYLVTSDFHMRRASAIAFLVFGSRGIVCTPVAISSKRREESGLRVLRDVVRSCLWMIGTNAASALNFREDLS